jgi:hypothetical protein
MMTERAIRWVITAFTGAAFVIMLALARAYGEPVDYWWKILAECQAQENRLDADDKRFVREMINIATIDGWEAPNPRQQRWLLDIKRRLEK